MVNGEGRLVPDSHHSRLLSLPLSALSAFSVTRSPRFVWACWEGGSQLVVATHNCAVCHQHPGVERQWGGSPRKSWEASE